MDTQVINRTSPLAWAAGTAVILFSGTGIAAIMGWIPASMGRSAGNPAAEKAAGNARPNAPAPHAMPAQVATGARTGTKCEECDVVESTREIKQKGEGSGIGIVGGAVVGGLLGNQIGNGNGKTVATAIGAVGGGVAGNEIEKRVKSTTGYEATVRFDDGTSRAFNEGGSAVWRTGDRVKVVGGVIQSSP